MQTEIPLGAEITPVPPGCVFVGPCSMELGASRGRQSPKGPSCHRKLDVPLQ